MRHVPCLLIGLLFVSGLQAQSDRFGIDPRVELMSIVFRLAGNPEYTQCDVPIYAAAIDKHFAPFRDHEAIRLARELRDSDGVSYDAVMNMAVHVTDVETLGERVPFDRAPSLDARWHGAKARRFLQAARKFVADSDFAGFTKSEQPLYDITNSRLQAFIAKNADLPWFDRFFGARAHAPFHVIPGLANGGSNYGAHVAVPNGPEEIYAIPGVWKVDSDGSPVFDPKWTSILVHEFAHSYVGPLIDKFAAQLAKSGDRLFEAENAEMRHQAYTNGKTVLNESMVRAATARYAFEHQGPEASAAAVTEERSRGFLWTGELVALLGKYAQDRERYPTLDSFMPQVVAFFDDVASRAERMVRDEEAGRPKIVSLSFVNGAQDVDPALKEIVVRFDRPMKKDRYAVARTSAVAQPKFGKVSFDETGRVFTIPVTLEPDKEYAFSLNWPAGGAFQSVEGVLLKAVEVKFRTRPAP
ncbi:MAG: DUF4932 domain-containing protein [Bryobacteraceae bacterium]